MAIANPDLARSSHYSKRTMRVNLDNGPFMVDVWEPSDPIVAQQKILLVHGWGGSGSYWRTTAEALARYGTVYVPDLPGNGRSLPIKASQNLFQQVESLGKLFSLFDLEEVIVIGHSMGSAMSVLLYDAHHEQISKMVLTSMCFFIDDDQKRFYKNIMQVSHLVMRFRPMFLANIPGMTRMMGSRYFYKLPDDPDALQQGLIDYLTLDYETAVQCADDAVSDAIPEAARQISIPTLLIVCREDQAMPVENVDYTVAQIPGCRLKWIEACGHLPMVEKPDEYLGIVKSFLGFEV